MVVRPIDANELLDIERLLDTDVIRKSKTASWLLDQVLHDIQAMPTLTPPNDWVRVEERLPNSQEDVLVVAFWHERWQTMVGWHSDMGRKWRIITPHGEREPGGVTHWMPLPAPPDKDNHVPAKATNEPLTIEQLREMKDEPAYLKVFDPLLKSGWHIIKAVTKDKIIFRGWQTVYVPIDGMGVNYNLYRCPPEGEEET